MGGVLGLLVIVLLAAGLASPAAALERRTLVHAGVERSYLVQKPSWHRTQRDPVIIVLHPAYSYDAASFLALTTFEALAEREAALLVAPEGVGRQWRIPTLSDLTDEHDNVGFIGKVLDEIIAGDNADPERILVTGMSAGGDLAFLLGCELSGRIAAIAPVAIPLDSDLAAVCAAQPPLPMMLIMGTADWCVPYKGGLPPVPYAFFLSAPQTVALWADRNGCATGPVLTRLPNTNIWDGSTVTKITYSDCLGGADAVHYRVDGGGHTWPGSKPPPLITLLFGRTNRDISAEEDIWSFFAQLPAFLRVGD